ncbi:hypothetical protein IKI14_05050 [bacterium]|nr:hypothetical protein [bacterium]
MKIKVITSVSINIDIENTLSYINPPKKVSHVQIKHFGVICKGVIIEEIQTIQRILNISDQITFPTHISYFFLIIAAKVAAISGRLVPAAIIVAQIAHSDTQMAVATYTADATMMSDDITKRPILAIIFVMLSNIQVSSSLLLRFFLLNIESENRNKSTHMNIIEYADSQKSILNPFSVFILNIDRIKIHVNKYIKFLISGSSIPLAFQTSSMGSFFTHRYQL